MRNRRHFTLIELVVSIALLVVIASITAMSAATFYQGYQRSLRVTERLQELMAIDALMDTHVRNAIPFQWPDEEGTSRYLFDGAEDRLHFTTLRRSYGSRPGSLLFIRVFVEDDELIAEYSPYPRFPWQEEESENTPWTREVLARDVKQVTFAYAENSTETEGGVEFLETYLEEDNTSLPLAIRMTVEWNDGRTEQWLRRVAASSANSSFGVRTSAAATSSTEETSSTAASASSASSSSAAQSGSGSGRSSGGERTR